MSKRNILILALVVAAALGAATYALRGTPPTELMKPADTGPAEIVVGYNSALSENSVAVFGQIGLQGFNMAVDEINAAGGILGKPVRAVVLDDKGNPDVSEQNMQRLIFEEKAIAVVGPANSGNALRWLDLAQNNDTVVIVHVATATELTQKFADRPRNYIFRVASIDSKQIRGMVAWAVQKDPDVRVAIIHDNTPYGKGGAADVSEALSRWGKTPVTVKEFATGVTVDELVPLIEEAREAGATAIYHYGLTDASANLLKAIDRVSGYEPLVLGTAANNAGLVERAGELAAQLYFPAAPGPDYRPEMREFYDRFVATYGKPPGVLATAMNGYVAMSVLKEAIEKAGVVRNPEVRDALENLGEIDTVYGRRQPFSKGNHEMNSVEDWLIGHWVDGAIVGVPERLVDLEIR